MNKAILFVAIFAFCLAPIALSSESQDRELAAINIGDLLKVLNATKNAIANATKPATNTTRPTTPSTPVVNTTTPSTPSTPSTPVANTTTPSTPAVNTTTPSTPSTPVVNTTTPSTPVANTTTPTTPTTPVTYAKSDVNMATFADDCLRVHNQERMAVGVANVTWSDSLAASAQAWANDMAVNGFRHSGKSGENIASSTYSTSTLERLLGLWTKEKSSFIVGCTYPSCSSNGSGVGHYTQMVWWSTTQIGCGFAPGVNKSYKYLCCQYYKAGNVVGQTVYPVQTA